MLKIPHLSSYKKMYRKKRNDLWLFFIFETLHSPESATVDSDESMGWTSYKGIAIFM